MQRVKKQIKVSIPIMATITIPVEIEYDPANAPDDGEELSVEDFENDLAADEAWEKFEGIRAVSGDSESPTFYAGYYDQELEVSDELMSEGDSHEVQYTFDHLD